MDEDETNEAFDDLCVSLRPLTTESQRVALLMSTVHKQDEQGIPAVVASSLSMAKKKKMLIGVCPFPNAMFSNDVSSFVGYQTGANEEMGQTKASIKLGYCKFACIHSHTFATFASYIHNVNLSGKDETRGKDQRYGEVVR